MDQGGLEGLGEQSKSEVLPAHCDRQEAVEEGALQVGTAFGCDCGGAESGAVMSRQENGGGNDVVLAPAKREGIRGRGAEPSGDGGAGVWKHGIGEGSDARHLGMAMAGRFR